MRGNFDSLICFKMEQVAMEMYSWTAPLCSMVSISEVQRSLSCTTVYLRTGVPRIVHGFFWRIYQMNIQARFVSTSTSPVSWPLIVGEEGGGGTTYKFQLPG